MYCLCSYRYSIKELRVIIDNLNSNQTLTINNRNNLIFFTKTFKEYLAESLSKKCSICWKNRGFAEIIFSETINNNEAKQTHLCCQECEMISKSSANIKYFCDVCRKEHLITKVRLLK